MIRRRLFLFGLAVPMLASCDGTTPISAPVTTSTTAPKAIVDHNPARIACARRGSQIFAATCTVERESDDQGLLLTIRHPDGGFHRFRVTTDGRGVIAADGAEVAHVKVLGNDQIEVALGGDRYRLPATIGRPTPPAP